MRNPTMLPYPLGLILAARPVNRDADRTEYAQRKAGRGIRLVTRNQMSVPARTVRGEAIAVTSYQLARWS